MRGFHGDSRPAKNSCRPSSRSISLEICYSHLETQCRLIITLQQHTSIYAHIHIYVYVYTYCIYMTQDSAITTNMAAFDHLAIIN